MPAPRGDIGCAPRGDPMLLGVNARGVDVRADPGLAESGIIIGGPVRFARVMTDRALPGRAFCTLKMDASGLAPGGIMPIWRGLKKSCWYMVRGCNKSRCSPRSVSGQTGRAAAWGGASFAREALDLEKYGGTRSYFFVGLTE